MANPKGWYGYNPKKVPKKGIFAKVNLVPEAFDQLVTEQGINIKVYRSVLCPNVKSIDGGEHEIDCPLCRGNQFVDRYPIQTRAVMQSIQGEMQHIIEGLYDGNTVQITFPLGIEMQYFTLIELVDFTEIYNQRVMRQQGRVDNLQYKAIRTNLVIDAQGIEYLEGSDFKIDINGNLAWGTNKGPVPGTIYSIHYETAMRYRTVRAMHANRFGTITEKGVDNMAKMPEAWLASKVYIVERKDAMGNYLKPNKLPTHDITEDTGDGPA